MAYSWGRVTTSNYGTKGVSVATGGVAKPRLASSGCECRLHRIDIKRRGWRRGNLRVHFHFKCADTSSLASSPGSLGELTKHDAISRNETLPRTGYLHPHLQRMQGHFRFWLELREWDLYSRGNKESTFYRKIDCAWWASKNLFFLLIVRYFIRKGM